MNAEGYAASGALVIVVLDRVFGFLRSQKLPNGKEHALVMRELSDLREDTKKIREQGHTLINAVSGLVAIEEARRKR